MVRPCVVPFCTSTDLTILCHRFPKRKEVFEQWQNSLNLHAEEPERLLQRFVVCTLHFKPSDYRNPKSRMLNAVAVPTLDYYDKTTIYDSPTTTIGSSAGTTNVKKISCLDQNSTAEIVVIESSEQDSSTTVNSALIIEPIEALEDDNTIYYIEEEGTPTESCDVISSNDNHISRTCSPVEDMPDQKRIRLKIHDVAEDTLNELTSEPQDEAVPVREAVDKPTVIVECRNSSAQTDDIKIVSLEEQLQQQMMEQLYPEYADCSRLDLAIRLKENEERVAELTKKLSNFETAHAAMMKTMEAFKTLVN